MVPQTTRHPSWKGRGVNIVAAKPGSRKTGSAKPSPAAPTSFLKARAARPATTAKIGGVLNRT